MKGLLVGIALLVVAGVAWSVTDADIYNQQQKIKQEESALDSLLSLQKAEGLNEILVADEGVAGVEFFVSTPIPGAVRDPLFVDVEVPWDGWSGEYQDAWDSLLTASTLEARKVSAGRYCINSHYGQRFIAFYKAFLEAL